MNWVEIWLQVLPNGLCWWALHTTEVKRSLNQWAHSFRVQLCLFPFVGRKTRQKLYFVCAKWARHCELVVTWALSLRLLPKIGISKKGMPITIITVILNSLQIQLYENLELLPTYLLQQVAALLDHAWTQECPATGKYGEKFWIDLIEELESDHSHCQIIFHFVKDYGNYFPNKLSQGCWHNF